MQLRETHARTHTHTYMYTHTHTYTHAHTCSHTHTHTHTTHRCVHVHVHTNVMILLLFPFYPLVKEVIHQTMYTHRFGENSLRKALSLLNGWSERERGGRRGRRERGRELC